MDSSEVSKTMGRPKMVPSGRCMFSTTERYSTSDMNLFTGENALQHPRISGFVSLAVHALATVSRPCWREQGCITAWSEAALDVQKATIARTRTHRLTAPVRVACTASRICTSTHASMGHGKASRRQLAFPLIVGNSGRLNTKFISMSLREPHWERSGCSGWSHAEELCTCRVSNRTRWNAPI
jgi:hypothetical protein